VGGAKLLVGLARVVDGDALTAIVNTGDDTTVYGVHVAPDVDIVTYWLAGVADTARGWGLRDDSFEVVDALGRLGLENWFRVGDRDLATCLYRTERLAAGATLSLVTDEVRVSLNIGARVVPMSDDPVRTHIVTTDERTLEFQEYFVKERCEPEVASIRFDGIENAKPAPAVLDAIAGADIVVLCPSNPVVSIGPIVSLPGVRDALRTHPRVVAVSPLIKGTPVKGPADRLLSATGTRVTASGVAELYADFCTAFVIDERDDPAEVDAVRALGIRPLVLDSMMIDHDASARVAQAILES
jgi:LPPG:FO 2-phospho-L-lactate transferase